MIDGKDKTIAKELNLFLVALKAHLSAADSI